MRREHLTGVRFLQFTPGSRQRKKVTIQRINQKKTQKSLTGFYAILSKFEWVHNSSLLIGWHDQTDPQ
jgi:hypothetical protein